MCPLHNYSVIFASPSLTFTTCNLSIIKQTFLSRELDGILARARKARTLVARLWPWALAAMLEAAPY